jgi:transaldolase
MPADGGEADELLARFAEAGVDVAGLAARLQREGAEAFVASWDELMDRIDAKTAALT